MERSGAANRSPARPIKRHGGHAFEREPGLPGETTAPHSPCSKDASDDDVVVVLLDQHMLLLYTHTLALASWTC